MPDHGRAERQSTIEQLVRELPDLFHVTCCKDDNTALCGIDASDIPETDGVGEQHCAVCFDLDEAMEDVCPLTNTRCPL